jgi:DNA topoisomerase VI subunit A
LTGNQKINILGLIMGDLNVKLVKTRHQLNTFTRGLLRDIHALERMLEDGWFNGDTIMSPKILIF